MARIWLSLPEEGVVRLEVFDVAGRRILEREVSGLGPGIHALATGWLPRGMLLFRVSLNGRTAVGRGVALH
jgi:hypothetical protein